MELFIKKNIPNGGDPNGAGIYGVPWIPSIYPLYVSIPAPWIRHGIYNIMIYYDYINGNFQPAMFNYRRV